MSTPNARNRAQADAVVTWAAEVGYQLRDGLVPAYVLSAYRDHQHSTAVNALSAIAVLHEAHQCETYRIAREALAVEYPEPTDEEQRP